MKNAKFLSLILIVVLSACGGEASPSMGGNKPAMSQERQSEAPIMAKPAANAPASTDQMKKAGGGGGGGRTEQTTRTQTSLDQTQKSQNQSTTERKIVRNADLQLESDAPADAQQKITAIAEGKGGFVLESQQSSSDVRVTTRDVVTMTVRVPASKFEEALEEIRKTASRVIVESVKSDDVTEDFIDTESDLKAKRALEAQFLEIMKRANTVEDALEVQRELGDVRSEIEKLEGHKRFLENQTSLSTIKVRVQTPAAISANSTGFFYRLQEAFGKGFDIALNFILGLVSVVIALLPFLLLIVLPIVLIIRYLVKKGRKNRTPSEIVAEELKKE
ncbi:MAG: DUF4349 domain-containing protein [Acidobacteria bacterium]|nr:DUF4349 domain-containing protein [Acidobacteriota bacterium]